MKEGIEYGKPVLRYVDFPLGTNAEPVWPGDVSMQSWPNLSKSSHSSFYLNVMPFKITQNVTKYLGYFCNKICYQELSRIAQSGPTA